MQNKEAGDFVSSAYRYMYQCGAAEKILSMKERNKNLSWNVAEMKLKLDKQSRNLE